MACTRGHLKQIVERRFFASFFDLRCHARNLLRLLLSDLLAHTLVLKTLENRLILTQLETGNRVLSAVLMSHCGRPERKRKIRGASQGDANDDDRDTSQGVPIYASISEPAHRLTYRIPSLGLVELAGAIRRADQSRRRAARRRLPAGRKRCANRSAANGPDPAVSAAIPADGRLCRPPFATRTHGERGSSPRTCNDRDPRTDWNSSAHAAAARHLRVYRRGGYGRI